MKTDRILPNLCAWLCLIWAIGWARAAEPMPTVPANSMVEWSVVSKKDHPDPFNEVQLDFVVTTPDHQTVRVPGFWAGGRNWRGRYSSASLGVHGYRTECSDPSDAGLQGAEGAVEVTPYRGDQPLFLHGGLRIAADHRHFAYQDGAPFLWLGDTWWMGLCARLKWPEDFQTLAADRKAKGFNVIQIVAGLYPTCRPSTSAAPTRRAFRGSRTTAGFGPSISTRRIAASFISSSRGSCRAWSAPGDITCRGWARTK